MNRLIFALMILGNSTMAMAQYEGDIKTINQEESEDYSAEQVLKRMIEGAGFRYYWATEGILDSDLDTKPCEECRSTYETIEHLANLSEMVRSTIMGEEFDRAKYAKVDSHEELIIMTNLNWVEAANALNNGGLRVENMKINFPNGSAVPFWNMINGPLADAIYHTGQLVSFRRMSGNPINPKVNVFMGKLND